MRFKMLFTILLVVTGCEEKIDRQVSSREMGLLVVEGVLTNENKSHLVRLTLPYDKQNAPSRPATGASVYIFEDTTISVLNENPPGSGEYFTAVRRAVSGKMYTLYIVYNGKQYFAQDTPRPVQPLENLRYSETNSGYSLILDPSGEDPNYIEHTISWNNTAACTAAEPCEGRLVFYDLKTIDVNEIYKPEKAPFHFPGQSLVVRKKYSVSPAYKSFLRSMLSETDWRGGVFDVQRSDVFTNLSKGAVGFFAVCSVVSDSTIVE